MREAAAVTMNFPLSAEERVRIEDAIEFLISVLDTADGDPDFEPSEDYEPEETDEDYRRCPPL